MNSLRQTVLIFVDVCCCCCCCCCFICLVLLFAFVGPWVYMFLVFLLLEGPL